MSLVCFVTQVLSTLMDSVPGARKSHLYLPRCACADRANCRPPFGKGIRLLHLPPLLAWARAKACL
jgi:hypothetical protein